MNLKTLEMESKAMASIVSLAQATQLDMDLVMEYHLKNMLLAIFYPNGSVRKAAKSQLRQQFHNHKAPTSMQIGAFVIIYMGFYCRLASPRKEDKI